MAPVLAGILAATFAQAAPFEACRPFDASDDSASMALAARLGFEFGVAASAMTGTNVKDVSGILRPAMPAGSSKAQVERIACVLGVSGFQRFRGSTAAGESAYVGQTVVPGVFQAKLMLVLKLVMRDGVLVRADAYLRAPASS